MAQEQEKPNEIKDGRTVVRFYGKGELLVTTKNRRKTLRIG